MRVYKRRFTALVRRSYGVNTAFIRRKESFRNTRASIQTPVLRRLYAVLTALVRRSYGVKNLLGIHVRLYKRRRTALVRRRAV